MMVSVFALLALSGPGRIDIVDGQTRYEVSRSLVDHGDVQVRNPEVWFGVFPGRGGQPHTYYRFPQSLAGVPALVIGDALGPPGEARRHFWFVLTSAAAAALLAAVYLYWFAARGLSRRQAAFWAAAGIFCTPIWYYGTSTFDDIFGSLVVTAAVALALAARHSDRRSISLVAGLLMGLAFNCKQPLGVFALAVVAARDVPSLPSSERLQRAGLAALGLLAGLAVYAAFDLWKFPPGVKEGHAELLKQYYPVFKGVSLLAPVALAISPAAGVPWYFPPILLCAGGLRRIVSRDRVFVAALLVSIAIFVGFICSISFFKGDPAWGPRYLTPVFALLWLFAPEGAARFRKGEIAVVLAAGMLVQVLALTVDPYRLYIQRGLPSMFGAEAPALYFHPATSHLLNRPREIYEIWKARHESGAAFTPWNVPTSTVTILDRVELGPAAVNKYKVLNSFRPWWVSHRYMKPEDRPVGIARTVLVLAIMAGAGVLLTLFSLPRESAREQTLLVPG